MPCLKSNNDSHCGYYLKVVFSKKTIMAINRTVFFPKSSMVATNQPVCTNLYSSNFRTPVLKLNLGFSDSAWRLGRYGMAVACAAFFLLFERMDDIVMCGFLCQLSTNLLCSQPDSTGLYACNVSLFSLDRITAF